MSAKAVILCSGSEPRPLPGLEIDGVQDRDVRSGDEQHRRIAPGAGRGDRRRRHRRRVRLGLHRLRRSDNAFGGTPARGTAGRPGPRHRGHPCQGPRPARHQHLRRSPGRNGRGDQQRRPHPVRDPEGVGEDRSRPVARRHRSQAGHRGHGPGGGGCAGVGPWLHRGRHRLDADQPPRRVRHRRLRADAGACARRLRRGRRRSAVGARREPRPRSTTARFRGSCTPIPRSRGWV